MTFPCGRKVARLCSTQKSAPDKGTLTQETIASERQLLRMASADFVHNHKGGLKKFSLLCIKNCRFRFAGQFWMNFVSELSN